MFLSTMMLMFVVTSCNKNQSAVKKLDGQWQLTKQNGVAVDADDISKITFTECKLKKDEYCDIQFSYTILGQTITNSGQFLVTDDGETLEIKFTTGGQTSVDQLKIKELSKSVLILETTEGSTVSTEEYKKL